VWNGEKSTGRNRNSSLRLLQRLRQVCTAVVCKEATARVVHVRLAPYQRLLFPLPRRSDAIEPELRPETGSSDLAKIPSAVGFEIAGGRQSVHLCTWSVNQKFRASSCRRPRSGIVGLEQQNFPSLNRRRVAAISCSRLTFSTGAVLSGPARPPPNGLVR